MARPRKAGVRRSKSGKSLGEPHVVAPEVMAVRRRETMLNGLAPEHADDQLAGFTLGILLLRGRQDESNPGGITQKQYDAGDRWSGIVRRHANIMGYDLKRGSSVKSPSFAMVGGGRDTGPDASDRQVAAIRDQFRLTYDAIMDLKYVHGAAAVMHVRNILYAVCIENRPAVELSEGDYGNLRLGLNTLARALRV